ncbi:MAG: 1-deoxy-D-xylulose-5-phosphate synthase [Bacteroidales bacterium]|nr:1-deoxy-D-xylulose-5-phosphate synthase [Bacteroidales bacterium]
MEVGLLDQIEYPSDLRKLGIEQLPQVCKELRDFIIDESSRNPGHFGASLGTVELTVALHYAFNTPYDRIIWDVGHQAYGHKILTGRKKVFSTNRKLDGISGFPNPQESEYDSFIAGHSSISISAATGMALAAKANAENRSIVAVIGDGALTGGEAFEALDYAGGSKTNILVILNDNDMAIDANVGGLHQYLIDVITSPSYNRFRDKTWNFSTKLSQFGPDLRELFKKMGRGLKSLFFKESNLFESLGFRYFGPIDGHNVFQLTRTLQDIQHIPGPKLLHIHTQKGKGFKPAEEEQTEWHAPRKFDKETGEMIPLPDKNTIPPKYQEVFGETLLELAQKDKRVMGVTPAMATGCSMNILMKAMPDRAFDVGIAEQHAVTMSAGMAKEGLIPFCNIYSTFMQRAYDQVIHDVALQNLHVVFCLDRAGIVGADGVTHHGLFDIPFMRAIPNIVVAAPMNEIELRNMMFTAYSVEKPFAIRYPRGGGEYLKWREEMQIMPIGKAECLRNGEKVAVLTIGAVGNTALKAVDKVYTDTGKMAAMYNFRWIKPIDSELIAEIAQSFETIITIEDGIVAGGFGSAVLEELESSHFSGNVVRLGVQDEFVPHGTQQELYKICGFDFDSIVKQIETSIN